MVPEIRWCLLVVTCNHFVKPWTPWKFWGKLLMVCGTKRAYTEASVSKVNGMAFVYINGAKHLQSTQHTKQTQMAQKEQYIMVSGYLSVR